MVGDLFVVGLAVIVIGALSALVLGNLILARRSSKDWRAHLRRQAAAWEEMQDEHALLDDVQPRDVPLRQMLDSASRPGSGYVGAQEIPFYPRVSAALRRAGRRGSRRARTTH